MNDAHCCVYFSFMDLRKKKNAMKSYFSNQFALLHVCCWMLCMKCIDFVLGKERKYKQSNNWETFICHAFYLHHQQQQQQQNNKYRSLNSIVWIKYGWKENFKLLLLFNNERKFRTIYHLSWLHNMVRMSLIHNEMQCNAI